jgi:hypothetical protein
MSSLRLIATGGGQSLDTDEVRRALAALADPEHGCLIFALPGARAFTFRGCHLDDLVRAAGVFGDDSTGIYYGLNPIPEHHQGAAKNEHVLRRRWLLVDVDPHRPDRSKQGATDREKEAARLVAAQVKAFHAGLDWPDPLWIDSGNGWHLLYRCELPNDDAAEAAVKAWLRRLAALFDGPAAEIDRKVYPAKQIAKLPGTWARKGLDKPDRPHRLARLVELPADSSEVVTADMLAAAVAVAPPTMPPPGVNGNDRHTLRLITPPDDNTANVLKRAIAYLATCSPAVSGHGGHDDTYWPARAVCWGFDLGAEQGFQLLWEHFNPRCQPPWSERELRHKCKEADTKPFDKPRGWLLVGPRVNGAPSPNTPAAPVELRIYTLPELMAMELPPPAWAVPGLLCEGLNILAGKPKLGKSFFALNIAVTLAAGGMALGSTRVVPGNVLYLALEDRLRRVQDRARKLLRGLDMTDAPALLQFAVEWPRQHQGGLDALSKWLDTADNPKLVIIDVWAKFRPRASSPPAPTTRTTTTPPPSSPWRTSAGCPC